MYKRQFTTRTCVKKKQQKKQNRKEQLLTPNFIYFAWFHANGFEMCNERKAKGKWTDESPRGNHYHTSLLLTSHCNGDRMLQDAYNPAKKAFKSERFRLILIRSIGHVLRTNTPVGRRTRACATLKREVSRSAAEVNEVQRTSVVHCDVLLFTLAGRFWTCVCLFTAPSASRGIKAREETKKLNYFHRRAAICITLCSRTW